MGDRVGPTPINASELDIIEVPAFMFTHALKSIEKSCQLKIGNTFTADALQFISVPTFPSTANYLLIDFNVEITRILQPVGGTVRNEHSSGTEVCYAIISLINVG